MIKNALINAIVLLAFSGLAQATSYYVSPNGSDSNNGTSLSTPFQTIQRAANIVNIGDTVHVRSGVYRERVKLAASGTLSQRITFKAYADEQPIIDGSKPVGSWAQYSEQIYRTSVTVNVEPVVIDDTILDHVGNIQQMTEGSFYQTGNALYVWCPGGGSPVSRDVGIIKDFDGWNEPTLVMITGNHISFSGFMVRYGSGAGIKSTGNFVRVENCNVKFLVYQGIQMENGWNCEVNGCNVHDSGLMNWPRSERSEGWPIGLCFLSGGNGKIIANHVFRNHGEGIGTYGGWGNPGTNGLIITDNISYDNWSVNIWIDHGSAVVVNRNLSYVSGNQPSPEESRSLPTAIQCAEESTFGNPGDLRDGIIINNIAIGCRRGFAFWQWGGNTSGLKNFLVANNTIVNSVDYGIELDEGNHTGSVFKNNIIFQTVGNLLEMDSTAETVFDHNCWFHSESSHVFILSGTRYNFDDWRTTMSFGTGSHWANPLFLENVGFDPSGYQISASSPCRNAGVRLQQVATDFWKTLRPQGNSYDIGAHQLNYSFHIGPMNLLLSKIRKR